MFLTVDAVKPVGSLNARNIKRVRYCLGAAVDGKTPLIRQQQTWNVETPPPSYSTASCDEKGTGGWESAQVVASDVVNTTLATPVPIFKYTPGPALSAISAIRAELVDDDERKARRP